MPLFSKESHSKLVQCHPDLQVIFFEVIKSFDCTIIEGYRNQEDQEKAFSEGKTTVHYPDGKHNCNPSLAADVAPYPLGDWSDTKKFYFFGGYVLGIVNQLKREGRIKSNVRWGGDWNGNKNLNDQTFNDLVHFELIS